MRRMYKTTLPRKPDLPKMDFMNKLLHEKKISFSETGA
jgi:hypothetical protein